MYEPDNQDILDRGSIETLEEWKMKMGKGESKVIQTQERPEV